MNDPIIKMLDDNVFNGGKLHIELENREIGLLAGSVINGSIFLDFSGEYSNDGEVYNDTARVAASKYANVWTWLQHHDASEVLLGGAADTWEQ